MAHSNHQGESSYSPKRQRTLPLTREERLRLIEGIDFDQVGIDPRSRRSVLQFLKQLEFCSTRGDDSHVSVEILAAHMHVDSRTVQRTARKVEEAKLVFRYERFRGIRQQTNRWSTNWDRIMAVQLRGDELPPLSDELPPPGDKMPLQGSNFPNLLSSWSTVDRDEVDQRKIHWTEEEIASTRQRANSVLRSFSEAYRKPVPCRNLRDRDLLAKVCFLVVAGKMPEAWLVDAIEGVRIKKPRNPWAYLNRCLEEGAKRLGTSFNAELRRITVPDVVLHASTSELAHHRLCTPAQEPT